MTRVAFISLRFSGLALLCACTVLLAVAAPAFIVAAGGSLDFLSVGNRAQENDVDDSQSETSDLTDDSALPATVSIVPLQPIVLPLSTSRPAEWAWSSTPPVRPPIVLN